MWHSYQIKVGRRRNYVNIPKSLSFREHHSLSTSGVCYFSLLTTNTLLSGVQVNCSIKKGAPSFLISRLEQYPNFQTSYFRKLWKSLIMLDQILHFPLHTSTFPKVEIPPESYVNGYSIFLVYLTIVWECYHIAMVQFQVLLHDSHEFVPDSSHILWNGCPLSRCSLYILRSSRGR